MSATHLLIALLRPMGLPLEADILTDPFGWLLGGLLHAIYGSDDMNAVHQALDGWMAHLLDPSDPHNPFRLEAMCGSCGSIYDSLRPLGLFALALAVLARIAGEALRSRHEGLSPVHLLTDAGVRLICGVAALQVTFPIVDWLSAQSMILAAELAALVFRAVLRQVDASTLIGLVFQSIQGHNQLSVATAVLLLTIFVGYISVMIVAGRAAIIFCVLGAPFSVPAMAYAEDSKVVVLWLRMLFFALALPAAAVLCLAMTVIVFAASLRVGDIGAFPLIALGACVWISVKVINGLMRATVRSARGGVSGTLHAAGMGPAVRGLGAVSRDARRDAGKVRGVARMAVGAVASGGPAGALNMLRAPGAGANTAFEMFASQELIRRGVSKVGGNDLPPRRQRMLRMGLWAAFLARESGLVGRPGRAA